MHCVSLVVRKQKTALLILSVLKLRIDKKKKIVENTEEHNVSFNKMNLEENG